MSVRRRSSSREAFRDVSRVSSTRWPSVSVCGVWWPWTSCPRLGGRGRGVRRLGGRGRRVRRLGVVEVVSVEVPSRWPWSSCRSSRCQSRSYRSRGLGGRWTVVLGLGVGRRVGRRTRWPWTSCPWSRCRGVVSVDVVVVVSVVVSVVSVSVESCPSSRCRQVVSVSGVSRGRVGRLRVRGRRVRRLVSSRIGVGRHGLSSSAPGNVADRLAVARVIDVPSIVRIGAGLDHDQVVPGIDRDTDRTSSSLSNTTDNDGEGFAFLDRARVGVGALLEHDRVFDLEVVAGASPDWSVGGAEGSCDGHRRRGLR